MSSIESARLIDFRHPHLYSPQPRKPFDFRPKPSYPVQPQLPRKRKPVTIAIGFASEDAIVLAADRQITSSMGTKYQEKKIFSFFGHGWSVSVTYAGYCDLFANIHEKLKSALHPQVIGTASFESVCRAIQRIVSTARKDHGLRMMPDLLIAISIGLEIRLYKAQQAVVSPAGSWKCLGFGESPLTHYLVDLLMSSSRDRFDRHEAILLAIYVVSQANQYIEGCNGGPDLAVIQSKGIVEILPKSPPQYDYNDY